MSSKVNMKPFPQLTASLGGKYPVCTPPEDYQFENRANRPNVYRPLYAVVFPHKLAGMNETKMIRVGDHPR